MWFVLIYWSLWLILEKVIRLFIIVLIGILVMIDVRIVVKIFFRLCFFGSIKFLVLIMWMLLKIMKLFLMYILLIFCCVEK